MASRPHGVVTPGIPYMAGQMIAQPPQQTGRGFRPSSINSRPQMYARQMSPPPPSSDGPTITVFVGNISERASEQMIKKILSTVGYVLNWKRVSTFGFCDYDGPFAGSRAVRLLHDLEVDGKRLVAKVDAKNKQLLDTFKEEEDRAGGARDGADEKRDDSHTLSRIERILEEHHDEMESFQVAAERDQAASKQAKVLKDTDLEEDKRDIIHREIGKFRKFAEEEEQKKEREKDRRKREDKPERGRRSQSPRRDVPDRKKERRRSRSIDRYDREREERERERERERDRTREDLASHKNVRDVQRSKEMDEELRERKKLEKRARDKEAAYQERLRNWELRERRKAKEYERDSERERCREEDREHEAKRLKEFLEDYEDERDDPKYYKGKELQRRLTERLREADTDAKDREREQDELEELKTKIFTGEYLNPTLEFERQKLERESLYKPKLIIDMNLEASQQREAELLRERDREAERIRAKERERHQKELYVIAQASRELAAVDAEPIDSDSSNEVGGGKEAHHSRKTHHHHSDGGDRAEMQTSPGEGASPLSNATRVPAMNTSMISLNLGAAHSKKKRLDVFSIDDESEDAAGPKKRKLVPLDYEDKGARAALNGAVAADQKRSSEEVAKSQEERRRHIKSIIDKIPTEKADLFAFQLEWSEIDQALMERKIRPWINKKIIEYIGEPEPTLVDFICSKVMAGSTPAGILDDVQMVLDEEAEVFVVKMWRLLIYEVEAKKVGLANK